MSSSNARMTIFALITCPALASCDNVSRKVYDSDKPTNPETLTRPERPQASYSTKMIFGGRPVSKGELLNIVGLTRPGSWTPSCTGTLIKPNMVLSAAHCFCTDNPTNGDVFIGENATKEGGKYYGIAKVRLLGTCPVQSGSGLDLAVVKLNGPVKQTGPLPYAADDDVENTRTFHVAGFGAIDQRALKYPAEKRIARTPKVSSSCRGIENGQSDAKTYGCRPGLEMVAGLIGFPDSCSGDSGGPILVSRSGQTEGVSGLKLAGVTSRSVSKAPLPCGYGGIYVRLTPETRVRITKAMLAM